MSDYSTAASLILFGVGLLAAIVAMLRISTLRQLQELGVSPRFWVVLTRDERKQLESKLQQRKDRVVRYATQFRAACDRIGSIADAVDQSIPELLTQKRHWLEARESYFRLSDMLSKAWGIKLLSDWENDPELSPVIPLMLGREITRLIETHERKTAMLEELQRGLVVESA